MFCDIIEECRGHFSEWKNLRKVNERLEKLMPYKYSNTRCDVMEIQDKSLFKVQKASQVEKFTIVVG